MGEFQAMNQQGKIPGSTVQLPSIRALPLSLSSNLSPGISAGMLFSGQLRLQYRVCTFSYGELSTYMFVERMNDCALHRVTGSASNSSVPQNTFQREPVELKLVVVD